MRTAATFLVLLGLLLSGCISGASVTIARAEGGFVSTSYAYDGNGTDSATSMRIEVSSIRNSGLVEAFWREAGRTYGVRWDRFFEQANRTYQAGGIVAEIHAHGATGQGDALLPRVHYISAGWGEGTVLENGSTLKDPTTGLGAFGMHYMLLRDGVRDPITHRIHAADGKRPYAPEQPADAHINMGSTELILIIKSMGAALPEQVSRNTTSFSSPATSVNQAQTRARMPVMERSDRLWVWVNSSGAAPTGQTVVQVKDPSGRVAKEGALNFGTRFFSLIVEHPQPGNWTVETLERSPTSSYRITWHTHEPRVEPWFRMLTFEAPRIEARERAANTTTAS